MLHKLLVVLIICMFLSAGCAPVGGLNATPTPAPTSSPIPSAFMTTSDFGIVSQVPCGAPCFLGIVPGVTTLDDAAAILQKTGAPCDVTDAGRIGMSVTCKSGGKTEIYITHFLVKEHEGMPLIVDLIDLRPPVKITVGELIARYGPPDMVLPVVRESQAAMWFSYDKLSMFVAVTEQAGTNYTVTADSPIRQVIYQTNALYQFSQPPDRQADRQPWKGYGIYAMPLLTPTP